MIIYAVFLYKSPGTCTLCDEMNDLAFANLPLLFWDRIRALIYTVYGLETECVFFPRVFTIGHEMLISKKSISLDHCSGNLSHSLILIRLGFYPL